MIQQCDAEEILSSIELLKNGDVIFIFYNQSTHINNSNSPKKQIALK